MITTEALVKTYKMGKVEVQALRGVDLSIKRGEFVGIMGPSGSGKSTLLHLMGLLDHPSSGRILIDNIDTKGLSDKERTMFRLRRLGYVFQDYALVPELNVFENVSLLPRVRGLEKERYDKDCNEILTKFSLLDRADHLPNEISGGQQQRVAIARAMVNRPEILFADEPCANLDTTNSKMVLDLCKEINIEMDQTIVMVSHEDWHLKYFDRVVYLKDGIIEKEDP